MQNQPYDISSLLSGRGIRPSAQRIAVLKALLDFRVHPTAEQIFEVLSPTMPTLSLTTVYNTLRLLADKGVIAILGMDRRYARFDYVETPHAHLWCRACGKVVDMPLSVGIPPEHMAGGFKLDEVDVCYKGLCPECNKQTI
ncbi:Fur family transcriptional regulator [uncultured Muribaculum sp.]|uniref:Fur family transcriptional regulator n=1 Tax=uncultured Muribaculum sp. TaxID=1918613 RepID=UPI0025B78F6A|nr:Fur family transcriptional regulator [uncultured Muribaculum sp.]